jgi:hypothetical protein
MTEAPGAMLRVAPTFKIAAVQAGFGVALAA